MARGDLVRRVTRQLVELRQGRITQERLAELLEVSVQLVSRAEAGQNITLGTLERFATALGYSVEVVFTELPEGPTKPAPSKRQRTLATSAKKSTKT